MVAKKGGKKHNLSKKGKINSSKVANKKINKLAKQGKLRPKKHRTKLEKQALSRQAQHEITEKNISDIVQEEEEEEVPLQDEDYKFFGANDSSADLCFLGGGIGSKKTKKRKIPETEEDYETVPRKGFTVKKFRHLLPIKTATGELVHRSEEVLEKATEDVAEDTKTIEPKAHEKQVTEEVKAPLVVTTAELYARRQQKLEQKKEEIAFLASAITESPYENMKKLKELRTMLDEIDPEVQITVKKYVMLSLAEVFKDIIPDYKIRYVTKGEQHQSQKKETKDLRDFESSLVNNYRLYIQYLETMATGKLPKKKKNENRSIFDIKKIPQKAKQGLAEVATQCLCSILIQHPEFNFAENIIATIVPLMNNKHDKIQEMVLNAAQTLFKQDRLGDVTLEIVKNVTKYIKMRSYSVKIKMLRIFMSLKIKEVDFKGDASKNKKMTHKEKLQKLSRKERKKLKQRSDLDKELENAAVLDNKNQKIKFHTLIVESVFLTYFRILKKAPKSILLSTVLEGLAKFAHLINLEFFGDLFAVLNNLLESATLTSKQMLHCIQTAFVILTEQGAALTVDPLNFYNHLYSSLLKLSYDKPDDVMPVLLDCLYLMFIRRKKQVTQQRALGYIKRLTTVALELEAHSAIGLLAVTRSIIHVFPRSDLLYDPETQGSGLFLPELDEPEHCNAQNTALWELHLLKRHHHPIAQIYAEHLVKQAPLSGNGDLQQELLKRKPVELFGDYNPSNIDNMFVKIKKPVNKKLKSKQTMVHEDFKDDMEKINIYLTTNDVQVLDFKQNCSKSLLNGNHEID